MTAPDETIGTILSRQIPSASLLGPSMPALRSSASPAGFDTSRPEAGGGSRANHERLVDAGGWYILSVVDPETEYILRVSLVRASSVDRLIGNQWTNCGRGGQTLGQYRQLPWSALFDPAETPGGERA